MTLDAKMAWRNIWRNPRRSLLTMAAIAFATTLLVFMLSWQLGSYTTMINATVKVHTGHVQVQARGYNEKRDMRKVVPEPGVITRHLEGLAGVGAHTSRCEAFSLVSSRERTYSAMVVGIDPDREARVSTLQSLIRQGAFLSAGDVNQALIGRLLARNLRVIPGDEMVLLGQGRDGSVAATVVVVKGIFDSGQDDFDRGVIQIPLDYFQEVYSMRGGVHTVVVACDTLEDVAPVVTALRAALPLSAQSPSLAVLDWKALNPGLVETIKMDLTSAYIFYLILIVVVAFSILNTFLMAILERTREFGVMMAMGTTPGRLARLLLMESAGMTLLGIGAGILIGAALTGYFQVHGIVIPDASELMRQFGLPERIHPRLSLLSVCVGAGSVLAITILAALYPALRVRRLRPVQALTAV